MSQSQLNVSSMQREATSQPVFHNGMMSPPPLDDMLFDPSADFSFDGDDFGAELNQSDGEALKNIFTSGSNASMQMMANGKNCPPTPTSLSQPQPFGVEGSENPELSSILDRPRKPAHRAAGFDGESKPRKQRRESLEVVNKQTEGKDRSREKNKIAAAKCRAKKRDNTDLIESSHRTLSAENSLLRKQEQQLRATVAELRTLALDHQSCSCGVHQYNMLEARKLAHGLGGMCSMMSANTVPVERRRKHSDPFGTASPNTMHTHNRSQSFAAPGQFGMTSAEDFLQQQMFGGEQSFFGYDNTIDGNRLDAQ